MSLSNTLQDLFSTPNAKHPKCKGYKYFTDWGYGYDCEHETKLDCDECKYGVGRKDPEAKCNKL